MLLCEKHCFPSMVSAQTVSRMCLAWQSLVSLCSLSLLQVICDWRATPRSAVLRSIRCSYSDTTLAAMAGVMSRMRMNLASASAAAASAAPSAAAVSTAAASDALSLAADVAAHPEDYALPAWVVSLTRLIAFLRSRNRAALQFKRRVAGAAALVAAALWVLRLYQAHQARRKKAEALATRAREAAAVAGGPLFSASSAAAEAEADDNAAQQSLGDKLMHPPEDKGLIPVASKSAGEKSGGGGAEGSSSGSGGEGPDGKVAQKHRVAVNALFFSRLRKILSIAVPSVYSTEFAYLTILTALLFARTFFSIYIAELIGMNAQSLVSRKWYELRRWEEHRRQSASAKAGTTLGTRLKTHDRCIVLSFDVRVDAQGQDVARHQAVRSHHHSGIGCQCWVEVLHGK